MKRNLQGKYFFVLTLHFLILCSSYNIIAQQSPYVVVQEKFSEQRNNEYQEKLFVHINRTFFITGEIIRFKIYLVDASLHKQSDLSKVAYVELLQNHSPVLQGKVKIEEGIGYGSFFLPATLESGNYTLRAYTHWMKNYSSEFYFHQNLTIVNTFKRTEIQKNAINKLDIQFFPEGGNLVDGIESKVAFKVTDSNGNSLQAQGAVINENNDTLSVFKTVKFGMGFFRIKPSMSHIYNVLIKPDGLPIQKLNLPTIHNKGYVVNLTDKGETLELKITTRNEDTRNLLLFVHSRQIVSVVESSRIKDGVTEFIINKSSLAEGINHITLFNDEIQPVCERLYFIKPQPDKLSTLTIDQNEYHSRSKASIQIDLNQLNVDANLSMSVYKIDSLSFINHHNIVQYLFLSSDLPGFIENPSFYFSEESSSGEIADLLMLTHGWRRFSWEDALNKQHHKHPYLPEYRGHLISGLVKEKAGEIATGIETYLSITGNQNGFYVSSSNTSGVVNYEPNDFTNTLSVALQTNPKLDSNFQLKFLQPYSNSFSSSPTPAFSLNETLEKALTERALSMQVQDIFYGTNFKEDTPTHIDTSGFFGKADEVYLLDNYTRFPVMEEVMREYVKGVWVRKRKDGFHFLVLDNVNKAVFDQDPLILLDGVPIFETNKIMELDPLQIKRLDVFTRKFYVGNKIFNGVVSYSSYKGDLAKKNINPQSLVLDYEGLNSQLEFYSPQYSNENIKNNRMPDQRTELLWEPNLLTKQGKTRVDFFTSDISGSFIVIIQGITKQGNPIYITSSFKVN